MTFYIRLAFTSGLVLGIKEATNFLNNQHRTEQVEIQALVSRKRQGCGKPGEQGCGKPGETRMWKARRDKAVAIQERQGCGKPGHRRSLSKAPNIPAPSSSGSCDFPASESLVFDGLHEPCLFWLTTSLTLLAYRGFLSWLTTALFCP
jgi:hypothetical protein